MKEDQKVIGLDTSLRIVFSQRGWQVAPQGPCLREQIQDVSACSARLSFDLPIRSGKGAEAVKAGQARLGLGRARRAEGKGEARARGQRPSGYHSGGTQPERGTSGQE